MNLILLLLLALPVALAGIVFWLERFSEEGWEDESGYHRGPEPRTQARR